MVLASFKEVSIFKQMIEWLSSFLLQKEEPKVPLSGKDDLIQQIHQKVDIFCFYKSVKKYHWSKQETDHLEVVTFSPPNRGHLE